MHAVDTQIDILDRQGASLGSFSGSKEDVAKQILAVIDLKLIHK